MSPSVPSGRVGRIPCRFKEPEKLSLPKRDVLLFGAGWIVGVVAVAMRPDERLCNAEMTNQNFCRNLLVTFKRTTCIEKDIEVFIEQQLTIVVA